MGRSGVPATIEHNAHTGVTVRNTRAVQETVQAFITAMDTLKLDMNAVDQLQPYLVDVVAALQRAPGVSPSFEHLNTLKRWLSELAPMRASDELNGTQVRQLLFDLEAAYSAFTALLRD